MRQLAALAFVAACGGGDDYAIDPNHPPDHPPDTKIDAGLNPPSDGTVDAPVDAASLLAGRVCLFTDARAFTTCLTTGAGGFKVTLGTETAMTAADGTFSIPMPTGTTTNLLWHVTATGLQPSVMRYVEGDLIPAMTIDTYSQLEDNNGVASMELGTGAIFARVLAAGAKVKGATLDATPQQLYPAFYDGTNPNIWLQTSTGAAGVAWLPDATLGTLTVKATYGTLSASTMLPVEDQAITYTAMTVQ